MNTQRIISTVVLALAVVLGPGCASQPVASSNATSIANATANTRHEQYSGFLGDYSQLRETTDEAGDKILRYVSPQFKPGPYHAVILDPVVYYPTPQATDQVSAQTLEEVRQYVEDGFRNKLSEKVTVATQPGPGVLRIRPAITSVAPQAIGRKPYQYIPIAFFISAVAGRDQEAGLSIEIDAVDSISGARLAAAVRRGVGEKLAGKHGQLTLNDLKPLLDRWIDTASSFVATNLR